MYINRDVWTAMTPAQRKAHLDEMPQAVTNEGFDAQMATDISVVEEAKKKGVIFVEGGAPFEKVMEERDKIQYGQNVALAKESGVKDPEAILDFYLAAYEKWKGIMAKIGDDREKFTQALMDEVYSKVDPESL
jgi:hypothetical protein